MVGHSRRDAIKNKEETVAFIPSFEAPADIEKVEVVEEKPIKKKKGLFKKILKR